MYTMIDKSERYECQLTRQIIYIKLLNKFVRSSQLAIDGASCRDDEQPISLKLN